MKKLLPLTAFFVLLSSIVFANVSHNQLVNIAGKQRMLSQKIAKVYLLSAYGANMSSLKSELSISKIIFERNLETLTSNANSMFSKEVKSAIFKERNKWIAFKTVIEQPVSESKSARVLELSQQLLKLCHDVVVKIKAENINDAEFGTNANLINTIDKAGKQRMLAQRLCLFFISKKIDLKNDEKNYKNQNILNNIFTELDESLISLLNSELNSIEVEEAIGNTMLTFENLRGSKATFLNGSASLNLVYSTTNKLTKNYDKLTAKYAQLKLDLNSSISNY